MEKMECENISFDLRLFDGDVQVSTQESLSPEIKEFYNTRLIDNAEPNLVHDQFGDEYDIPNGTGSTIEYRKFSSLEKATEPLVEGVTKAGNKLRVSAIKGEVHQYGDYIKSSDIIQMTAADPIVIQKTKLLGSQAGRTLDTITREVLNSGYNVFYAPKEDGTEVLSRAQLTEDCRLTPDIIFRCQAQLEAMNAEPINGSYVGIIHPYAAYDLMRFKDEWVNVLKYAKPENYFRGEIGMIGNVRFVKSSEAKIMRANDLTLKTRSLTVKTAVSAATEITVNESIAAEDAPKVKGRKVQIGEEIYTVASCASGSTGNAKIILDRSVTAVAGTKIYPGEYGAKGKAIFSTLILGAHAYAKTKLKNGGLKHIVKPLGYNDELDRISSVGWKATKGADILSDEYLVRVESLSQYSDSAKSN